MAPAHCSEEKPYSLRLWNYDRTISARRRRQLIAAPNLAISASLHYVPHKLPATLGARSERREGCLSVFLSCEIRLEVRVEETIKVGLWVYLGQWLNARAISWTQSRHHLFSAIGHPTPPYSDSIYANLHSEEFGHTADWNSFKGPPKVQDFFFFFQATTSPAAFFNAEFGAGKSSQCCPHLIYVGSFNWGQGRTPACLCSEMK